MNFKDNLMVIEFNIYNMENLEDVIKQEVIKFTEWLWVSVDEKKMSQHDWDYWYEYYKNENKNL